MSHLSSPPGGRFRLRTFGSLALLDTAGDTILGRHGHHRRRLALLAVLASAGEQGRSRDQLLLFFWPEATQSRARHSLEQLLYALRASIGESLFAGTNPVRLNAEVVSSDVADVAAALARDDLEEAVRLHRGPFLDGFYLGDAPEFERWVESERARLAGQHAGALTRLAQRAESARDHAAAVQWWRALTDLDPVSGTHATGLIRALMNHGDHAAALQFAERYEAIVAAELGASVGPAVAGLVAEVRAEAATERVSAVRATGSGPTAAVARVVAESTLATAPPAGEDVPATDTEVPLAPRAASPERRGWRPSRTRALVAAGVVLASAIGLLVARVGRGTAATEAPALAVLPFASASRDARDSAFADGLAGEMIASLSRIGGLRVIARGSSFAFSGDADPRRVGDSLHVSHVLEGSVQREGDRLRVQVRLVNTADGATRWTESFDRAMADVFAVQSEVADAVARALDLRLGEGARQQLRRPTTGSIAAWELYVRARDPVHQRSPEGLTRGLALLEQAIALDSTFAAAWAHMPYMYFGMAGLAPNRAESQAVRERALASARRALALDSLLPEAWSGLAIALAMDPAGVGASEDALRRSLALGVTPRVREHLARVLLWSGRHEEALVEVQRAAAADPLSATATADVGQLLCLNGRVEEGLAHLARVADLRTPLQRVATGVWVCEAMRGRWAAASAALGDSRSHRTIPMLAYALARGGDIAQARRLRAEAVARWEQTGEGASGIAIIDAGLGDLDSAFVWLDRSVGETRGLVSPIYPLFAELHADPRFARYRERLGISKR